MIKVEFFVRKGVGVTLWWLCAIGMIANDSNGQSAPAPKVTTNVADKAECKGQLLRIHAAIDQYRSRHNSLPDWLSDLSREKLIPQSILICPYVRRTAKFFGWRGDLRPEAFTDTKSLYSYEFGAAELALFGGATTTLREYKERQLKLMGSNAVPIVRCFAHRPVLNLVCDGSIYESGTYWEAKFEDRFSHDEITPEALFADRLHLPKLEPRDFPLRDPRANSNQLDLTKFYNARLSDNWQAAASLTNNLASLPLGLIGQAGVNFDARGILQLKGKALHAPYPMMKEGIMVKRKCQALHFLHAAAFEAPFETQIGRYLLHYADGSDREISLLYGRDMADWWYDAKVPAAPGLLVAWQGTTPASLVAEKGIQLYRSRFENLKPHVEIESIDFVSANANPGPFLLAITLE